MMKKQFFVQQINRLKENYGENSYPKGSVIALWQEIGHVSESRFERCVTRLLASHVSSRMPPGIEKIESTLAMIREDETNREKEKIKGEMSAAEVSKRAGEILKLII